MPDRYIAAIMKYLADRDYQPLKPRQLARSMGVSEEDYGTFRDAVKQLRDSGRVVLGAKNALMLPEIQGRLVGFFRANPRGFGFIVPETPNAHGDLFVPPDSTGGALTGDLVVARVRRRGKRDGHAVLSGEIVEVLQRGKNRFVGTLRESDGTWFVMPDGRQLTTPIVIRDVGAAGPKSGAKVVTEIIQYPAQGELPIGVIVETLGQAGPTDIETLAVIRAHGLEDQFEEESLADARRSVKEFDPDRAGDREDLTGKIVVTIDPPDARDFDDAISIEPAGEGRVTLGVHIADVSHFVAEGSALDAQARRRGNSTYFPRRVIPMLPEILSNGVCSLQEGQRRFCKSAFITYDADGNILNTRLAETVISSAKRLTYIQAQDILGGKTGGYDRKVVALLGEMNRLARAIERRRRKVGMLHLDLPAVELVFDKQDRVVDAVPEDTSYTHTIIEMFMVEANDAVARTLDRHNRAFIRRIHPEPDQAGQQQLSAFVRAAGHRIPRNLTRKDMQELLAGVRGKPESYAVNLALLKTFEQAEYSPIQIGHWALASDAYCHFTSPIRRYADLTVHRLVAELCRGTLRTRPPEDMSALVKLGESLTAAEKRSEAAEREVREVLVLQLLATRLGETFNGVITGMTNFGLFVQSPQFLIEGLLRLEELGDDWWEVDARRGQVRGERTGKVFRIGDLIPVIIADVDLPRRQLNLVFDRKAPAPQRRPKGGASAQPAAPGKAEKKAGRDGGKNARNRRKKKRK